MAGGGCSLLGWEGEVVELVGGVGSGRLRLVCFRLGGGGGGGAGV